MAVFRNLSIRHKLFFIVAISSSVALVFTATAVVIQQWQSYRGELVKTLHSQTELLVANSAVALLFNDKKAAQETLNTFSQIDNIVFAMLHDKNGEPFAIYVRKGMEPPPHHNARIRKEFDHRFSATRLDFFHPIIVEGEVIGIAHVESDLLPLYENIAWSAGSLFLATLLGLGIAMILVTRLHPAITSPIDALVRLMRDVSQKKDYALRAEAGSKDEIGALAVGFNHMLARVQRRDTELEQHRAHLESEVAQRTADLKDANVRLERELTERKRAEEQLRASELLFRTIYDGVLDGIFVADIQTKQLVNANRRGCTMLGYELEELTRLNISEIHPIVEWPMIEKTFERQASGEIALAEALPVKRKNGTVFYADVNTSRITLDGRECLLGVFRDITERMRAEGQIRKQQEITTKIIETIPLRVFWKDRALRYLGCNTAFAKDAGENSPGSLMGKDDFQLGWKEQAEIYRADDKRVMETDTPKLSYDEPQTTPSGGRSWLRTSKVPLHDDTGAVIGLLGTYEDITEYKLAEEEIRKLNETLEAKVEERTKQLREAQEELVRKEKLSTLGQVAGSVGHELRNPLGVMSNAVYFLQTVLSEADPTTKEYLGIIKDEIGNADRIVGDLLDSVRTKPPQLQMVAVGTLLDQVLRKIAVPSGVNVTLNLPATLPAMRIDPVQMQQVFRNLISNAIDAMPKGGNLEISATEDKEHKRLSVTVKDSGTGIAPENLARLFQPLFTTKARGIGLGLVVVKNLTQNNGGSLTVESEPGKGSTFTVMLPLDGGAT
jgi:PAS domain S-box-containing protein